MFTYVGSVECSASCAVKLEAGKPMGAKDYLKADESTDGSKTYVEFHSDVDVERQAYRLCSRGGRIREGVEDMSAFFGELVPHVATYLFDGNPNDLLRWLGMTQEDLDSYAEECLDEDGEPISEDDSDSDE